MKKFMIIVIFALLSNICYAGTPHQLTMNEKLFDFSQLINSIKNEYGPKEYKEKILGINVDNLTKEYLPLIKETKNNGEFYSLIIKFVAEFHDGHFRARIPTNYTAYLPFDVTLIEDRALIEYVNRDELSKDIFPFDRGDELTAIDGRPASELIDELVSYIHKGNPLSTRGWATYLLTWRPGSRGLPVPSGDVSVTLKSLDGSKQQTIKMEWSHKGEPFDENVLNPTTSAMKALVGPIQHSEPSSFDPSNLSIFDIVNELRPVGEFSYHCNPKSRIAIPEDATILMEDPFTAYYYPTEKGNVGYLRIPDFSPPDEDMDGQKDYDNWLEYYTWVVDKLEKNTVGLIIDEDHNCGGSSFYMEGIVSLFMKGKFKPLTEEFRASKEELLMWKSGLQNWFERPYYLARDAFEQIVKLIEDSISKGLFLTPKTTLWGDQLIQGNGSYTKPVIVLVDYYAGSCGDAFPAMMQGLGRAKLLGTATGGLGGYVQPMEPLFYSQITYDMTQSLFFHPDGHAIENVGAIPDIDYEITIDDFVNGFTGYRTFYTEELLKLIY